MPVHGFKQVRVAMKRQAREVEAELTLGARRAATVLKDEMQAGADQHIIGQSGATQASLTAYVATDTDDGGDTFGRALDTATALLNQFDGHDGTPYAEPLRHPRRSIQVVGTVPTSYQDDIELTPDKAFLRDAGNAAEPGMLEEWLQPAREFLKR